MKQKNFLRAIGLFMAMTMLFTISSTASARILFQDDTFSDDPSEGLRLNFDDAGDEDVTLQFGNDGTDGTIIWDDGTSTLNIGDGVGSASIDTDSWDITDAGVASGFTGFTSTGVVDFSGASRFAFPSGAVNPATCTVGDGFFNTTDAELKLCVATNTWNTSGPQDFEDVYAYDADNTLTTTGPFTIDSVGALTLDSDAATTIGGADVDLSSDSGDVTLTSADDILFDDAQLLVPVQLTENATAFAGALPSTGIIDNVNAFTSTANGEGASLIGVEDAAGNFVASDLESVLVEISDSIDAASSENGVLRFYPEYPDTVYDDSSARGKLESVDDATEGNAYKWTTKRNSAQTLIVQSRFELPADYVTGGDLTLRYLTDTALVGDNSVALELYNVTNSQSCGTVAASASTTWATMTLASATIASNCTGATALDAGDVVEVRASMMANDTNDGEAYLGYFDYDYSN